MTAYDSLPVGSTALAPSRYSLHLGQHQVCNFQIRLRIDLGSTSYFLRCLRHWHSLPRLQLSRFPARWIRLQIACSHPSLILGNNLRAGDHTAAHHCDLAFAECATPLAPEGGDRVQVAQAIVLDHTTDSDGDFKRYGRGQNGFSHDHAPLLGFPDVGID